MRSSRDQFMKVLPWIATPVLVALTIVVWWAITASLHVNPLIFPGPGAVWQAEVKLVQDAATWSNAMTTLVETVVGFLIAVVVGAVLGVVLGKIVWLEVSLRPLIVIAQVVPKVAFVPLFVIWFGFGMTSKIFLAALLAFFPVMLNVLLGVRSVERGHREVMKSLNASRMQTFTQLEARSILPYLFTGMEVAIVLATIGAIVAEYLSGNRGLGYMVLASMNALDAQTMFAVIVLLSVLGLLLYFAITGVKRFVIPWHESVYVQNAF